MGKIYSRVNWENSPSTNTPVNAENLNKMEGAIKGANASLLRERERERLAEGETYNAINWVDLPDKTTPINAENLNKMESAIVDMDQKIADLASYIATAKSTILEYLVGMGVATGDETLSEISNIVVDRIGLSIDSLDTELEELVVSTPPNKTAYKEGDLLDLSGVVLTAKYKDIDATALCAYSPAEGTQLNDIGDFQIEASFEDGGITKNVYINATVSPHVLPWATATWDQIAEAIEAHDRGDVNLYAYWNIGDQRVIEVPETSNEVYSISSYHPILTLVAKDVVDVSGGGKCHFVWQQENTFPIRVAIRNTNSNIGGWGSTEMRTFLNGPWFEALPEEMKNLSFECIIKTSTGGFTPQIQETTDKIFLPCCYNVYGTLYNNYNQKLGIDGEDDVYWDYYKVGVDNVPKKILGDGTDFATNWWLRSPLFDNASRFNAFPLGNIMAANTGYSSANYFSIAPCGCI